MSKQLCPEPTRTQGGAATPCQAGPVCEEFCFKRKCSPGTVETGSYLYDIAADCSKTNERWVDATGAAFDPAEVYRVDCVAVAPAAPAEPVEVACQPVTVQYADCDGILQTATGTTCDLIQVVPHPAAVMKVQICNPEDRELIRRCDPVTGGEVLLQYDVTTTPPTLLSATNLTTNTPYTGSLTALTTCGADTSCTPTIASATADQAVTLPAGTTISVQKPDCCVVKVDTTAGAFLVAKHITGWSTAEFDCLVTVNSVSIVSGTCSLTDVIVTTQFKG